LPLKELTSNFSGYSALCKVTNGRIDKVMAGKIPGGFSEVQTTTIKEL
jgi:hypothetical protein